MSSMIGPPKVDAERAREVHHVIFADAQGYGLTFRQAVNSAWTISARASQAAEGTYEKRVH